MEEANLEQSSDDSIDVETVDTPVSETLIDTPVSETLIDTPVCETLTGEETIEQDKTNDNDIDSSLIPLKIDYEAIGEFCFESDILALKGNNDYKNVLEAIVILEAQRDQAVKDLDVLLELQDEALADPLDFVERLKRKENMNIPTSQRVHPVPSIDWGKYALSGDPSTFRRRQLSKIAADVRKNLKRKLNNPVETQEKEAGYWSPEEEKHLEELLIKFPPERNQTARWEKIAECLENRTAFQVAKKAQECFAKLAGNGILSERIPRGIYSKKKKLNIVTGLQQSDNEEENSYQESPSADENSLDSKIDVSDDEEIDPELYDTAEYQELLLYKRLLKKRIKSSTMTQHLGFKCSWCKCEPILGVRYHCIDCNPAVIDFCDDCVGGTYEIGKHTAEHQLEEIHHSNTGFLDRDYMHFLGNDYNYLDPNYMPAA